MATTERADLGNFMNVVCFQYLRICTEDVAGRAPIVAAGRKRGYDVIEGLGLMGSTTDPKVIRDKLDAVLGQNGTRLCKVEQIVANPNGSYSVRIKESACTLGQTSDEPFCAFSLGVFVGAIHAITGVRMLGRETTCEACGHDCCTYEIEPA